MTTFDPYRYRETTGFDSTVDIVEFNVEATDGTIGSVDEASHEVGSSYIVVDTGPWIFGRKVMLPAGTIAKVDNAGHRIFVDRSKHQIRHAPEFDPDSYRDPEYQARMGGYYEGTYGHPAGLLPPL